MFGCTGQATAANCHTPATAYLEKDLNQTGSIVHFAQVSLFLALICIFCERIYVQSESKKVAPLKLFAIFSLRLSVFP